MSPVNIEKGLDEIGEVSDLIVRCAAAIKGDDPEALEELRKWLREANMRKKSLLLACLVALAGDDERTESDGED